MGKGTHKNLKSISVLQNTKKSKTNMASRLLLLSILLFFCFAMVSSDIESTGDEAAATMVKGESRRLLAYLDCGALCKVRCSLHSRQNVCQRACGTCCVRCKCVPPGTSGNREVCGTCYTDMTTHGNNTKCP